MKWYSLKIGSVAHYMKGSEKIQSVKLITLYVVSHVASTTLLIGGDINHFAIAIPFQ